MNRTSRRLTLAAVAVATSLVILPARAQTYPDKPITLIVPNAAGGAADNLARSIAEELGKRLHQVVIVENLGGASGALAAQRVLRAAPDGYTLLFGTTSDMVVTPIANRSVNYAAKDFTPIAKVGITPMTLVARTGLGVSTADQWVALARQKPNGLSVGTTGAASLQAFATVALQRAAQVDLLPVPYKGGAPMINDLLAGPPKLPAPVVERLSKAVQELLNDKEFTERRAKQGDVAPPWTSPGEFGRFLAAEDERYRQLATGMKLE